MTFILVDTKDIPSAPRMYRYDGGAVGSADGYVKVTLILREFIVVKETPKGKWVRLLIFNQMFGDQRFILNKARKRYACETVEEARLSFIARKKKQIRILESQLEQAMKAFVLAEKLPGTFRNAIDSYKSL